MAEFYGSGYHNLASRFIQSKVSTLQPANLFEKGVQEVEKQWKLETFSLPLDKMKKLKRKEPM